MNQQQLQIARAAAWRQNGQPLLTLDAAGDWLEEAGLCLFLPRNAQLPAPAPSLIEAMAGEGRAVHAPAAIDSAMELVTRLVEARRGVPLNLMGTFTEQPDFLASPETLRWVAAVRGDRSWKAAPGGRTAPIVLRVWEALDAQGGQTAAEIQEKLGRALTEGAVLRALIELWTTLRAFPAYAIGEPTRWSLGKQAYAKELAAGANTAQTTALSALISQYLKIAVAATEEEVEVFLSPLTARSRIREVLHGMLATRQFNTMPLGVQTLLYLEGSLPEAEAEEPAAAERQPTQTTPPPMSAVERKEPLRKREWKPGRDERGAERPRREFPGERKPAFAKGPKREFGSGPKPGFGTGPKREFGRGPKRSFTKGQKLSFGKGPKREFGTGPKPPFGEKKPWVKREGGEKRGEFRGPETGARDSRKFQRGPGSRPGRGPESRGGVQDRGGWKAPAGRTGGERPWQKKRPGLAGPGGEPREERPRWEKRPPRAEGRGEDRGEGRPEAGERKAPGEFRRERTGEGRKPGGFGGQRGPRPPQRGKPFGKKPGFGARKPGFGSGKSGFGSGKPGFGGRKPGFGAKGKPGGAASGEGGDRAGSGPRPPFRGGDARPARPFRTGKPGGPPSRRGKPNRGGRPAGRFSQPAKKGFRKPGPPRKNRSREDEA